MKKTLRLATSTCDIDFTGMPIGRCVDFICNAGFRYLDLSMYNIDSPVFPLIGEKWRECAEEAGAAAEAQGAEFIQAHAPSVNCFDEASRPEIYERGITATLNSIEVCGMLGIKALVVHPGYAVIDREGYFKANRSFFERLLPTAEKYGVKLCAENSAEGNMGPNHFFFEAEELNSFIDYVGHPLLAVCWDTGHANMRHMDQGAAIRELGSNLAAMHIQDNLGRTDDHMAPLQGTTDFNDILRAVYDIGYDGAFALESNNVVTNAGSWPNPRPSNGPVSTPCTAVRAKAEELLFAIGTQLITAEF